jgi:formylglycine-generating enzyme
MKFVSSFSKLLLLGVFTFILSSCEEDVTATMKVFGLYNADETSCMVRGTVNVVGDDIIEAGFLITSKSSTSMEVLTYKKCQKRLSSGSLSDFTIALTGLSADSSYRFRLFARSTDSVYYGVTSGFRPIPHPINTVLVNGGVFDMGATSEQQAYAETDEYPVHTVTLSSFYMGQTEVTNAQFAQFLKSRKVVSSGIGVTEFGVYQAFVYSNLHGVYYNTDSATWSVISGYENNPVVRVTWYGANEFCRWSGGRLPTEAEWEWAARGGSRTSTYVLSGGGIADVDNLAWYKQNTKDKPVGFKDTQPVATKSPNSLGIYDMSGNAWEWVQDWYLAYLPVAQIDPKGMSNEDAEQSGVTHKVLRGGGWADGETGEVDALRITNRNHINPTLNMGSCGFRLAKD